MALASALILALGASGARALERPDDPDPVAVPRLISVEGPAAAPGAAPTPPSGASLMAAVNEYVAARIDDADDLDDDDRYAADDAAPTSSPPVTLAEKLSACGVGFADTDALRAVACPAVAVGPGRLRLVRIRRRLRRRAHRLPRLLPHPAPARLLRRRLPPPGYRQRHVDPTHR